MKKDKKVNRKNKIDKNTKMELSKKYLITFYILLGIHKDRRRNVIRKSNSEEVWYNVRGNYQNYHPV